MPSNENQFGGIRRLTTSVTQLALFSRFCVFLIQFIANRLIPDHDADAFQSPYIVVDEPPPPPSADWLIEYALGGFRHWDAQYFLHIAEHGYVYEQTLAFQPLYPVVINVLTRALLYVAAPFVSFRSAALLSALTLNTIFFVMAAHALNRLTALIFNRTAARSRLAVWLFCWNPASVFFSAPYTESLFAWLTFTTIFLCARKRFVSAALPLALCILCRSNGIVNVGFLLYYGLQEWMTATAMPRWWRSTVVRVAVALIVAALAFIMLNWFYFVTFCEALTKEPFNMDSAVLEYGMRNDLVMPGEGGARSPWCQSMVPLSYSYVQRTYWSVGLFEYYQWKQLPNFLLATPIVALLGMRLWAYGRAHPLRVAEGWSDVVNAVFRQELFVFAVHATFLLAVCIGFVHIQVTTRLMASASPLLYWIGGRKDGASFGGHGFKWSELDAITKFMTIWCGVYFVVGTTLFSNSLPWT